MAQAGVRHYGNKSSHAGATAHAATSPRPVVLVSLDWARPGDPRTGLGIASIASALRGAGVPTRIVSDAVNREGFDARDFIRRVVSAVSDAGPGALCGIGAFVWNEPEVVILVGALREATDATLVLGGPQVSYVPRGGLEALYPGVELFVRGNGEGAMVALATGGAVDNIGLHRAGTVDRGERADLALDTLPSPHLDGTLGMSRSTRWETQRGCPFACSFCQHREPGNRLRNRHLAESRVMAEAAAFVQAGVTRISVLDPIFNADRTRAVELLRGFNRIGLESELSLQCRFEFIDDAFVDAVADLNVVLEFGLQTAIATEGKIVGRRNRLDLADSVIERLHHRGIPFEVSLIYGLPTQTLETFARSVEWCRERQVPRIRAWPLMLLRGTPLHADRARWGLVESSGQRIPIVVESTTFTRADHAAMSRIAAQLEQDATGMTKACA